jgi:hypothetical protein
LDHRIQAGVLGILESGLASVSDDTTQPKLHLELPDLLERRAEYRRRTDGGAPKIVAVPIMWIAATAGSVALGIFWIGFNWSAALSEVRDTHREVLSLRESVALAAVRLSEFDKSVAVLQKQLEIETTVRRVKAEQTGVK